MASLAGLGRQHPSPAPVAADEAAALALRDELTLQRLREAAGPLHEAEIVAYLPAWWDGQSWSPCLVLRTGHRLAHHTVRVVEDSGEAVVLPGSRRTAVRALAVRRSPPRPELIPGQRDAGHDVIVDADDDVLRCQTPGCAALRPVTGTCPRCGGSQPVS